MTPNPAVKRTRTGARLCAPRASSAPTAPLHSSLIDCEHGQIHPCSCCRLPHLRAIRICVLPNLRTAAASGRTYDYHAGEHRLRHGLRLIGGYVAARLARRRPLAHGVAVAALLALGATISLLSTLGRGAVWSQVAALVLMAPCAVLGSWLRSRQVAGA